MPKEKTSRCDRSDLRMRHRAQPRLRLFGHAGEDHGDVIAEVLAAGARDDDAGAIDAAVVGRRLQRDGHFRPRRKRGGAAELNAVLMNHNGRR